MLSTPSSILTQCAANCSIVSQSELQAERETAGSCTVCLINAFDVDDLEEEDDYQEMEEEVWDGCSRDGQEVVGVHIPRKTEAAVLAGRCFVMFGNPADARKAVQNLNGKMLGHKKLRCKLVADVVAERRE